MARPGDSFVTRDVATRSRHFVTIPAAGFWGHCSLSVYIPLPLQVKLNNIELEIQRVKPNVILMGDGLWFVYRKAESYSRLRKNIRQRLKGLTELTKKVFT